MRTVVTSHAWFVFKDKPHELQICRFLEMWRQNLLFVKNKLNLLQPATHFGISFLLFCKFLVITIWLLWDDINKVICCCCFFQLVCTIIVDFIYDTFWILVSNTLERVACFLKWSASACLLRFVRVVALTTLIARFDNATQKAKISMY